jgi:hypothetical protein
MRFCSHSPPAESEPTGMQSKTHFQEKQQEKSAGFLENNSNIPTSSPFL